MATVLETESNAKVSVVFNDPQGSSAFNRQQQSVPRGILRGSIPGPGLGTIIALDADPLTLDSVIVATDRTPSGPYGAWSLTYRELGQRGLDLAAAAGTTVHVGFRVTYTASAATVAEWVYYTDAEFNNGDAGEAV